jgi:hypothetical protein
MTTDARPRNTLQTRSSWSQATKRGTDQWRLLHASGALLRCCLDWLTPMRSRTASLGRGASISAYSVLSLVGPHAGHHLLNDLGVTAIIVFSIDNDQNETEQPDHPASLGDSITASHSDEVFGTHRRLSDGGSALKAATRMLVVFEASRF